MPRVLVQCSCRHHQHHVTGGHQSPSHHLPVLVAGTDRNVLGSSRGRRRPASSDDTAAGALADGKGTTAVTWSLSLDPCLHSSTDGRLRRLRPTFAVIISSAQRTDGDNSDWAATGGVGRVEGNGWGHNRLTCARKPVLLHG